MNITPESTAVRTLGPRMIDSPLRLSTTFGDGLGKFVPDRARMPYTPDFVPGKDAFEDVLFEKAGPRQHIYFDPAQTKAAIVTCGGLCPGLNNVIRSLFFELHYRYGVREVVGIPFGYQGMNPKNGHRPIHLSRDLVSEIHKQGGTILGSSRGPVPAEVALDFLERERIHVLFCIGGDGTQKGAHAISQEAAGRNYPLSVVGIPKTIDNDIQFCWRSFGYFTAIEKAREVIDCAHTEARGAINGVSIVKVMGRDAGFIAAGATAASQEVNFTLIPEVPFSLEGENGLLRLLQRRLEARGHAVMVVAEGAGQDLMGSATGEADASGNPRPQDIGLFLQQRIRDAFAEAGKPVNVRYIDPSYIIRSVAANTDDALLCDQLARNAAHAAMAGKTDVLIGFWYNVFIHVPISLVTEGKKHLSPESEAWAAVLACTGQPERIG